MDFIKNAVGSVSGQNKQSTTTDGAAAQATKDGAVPHTGSATATEQKAGGGGLFNKFNEMAGGGQKAEANEDYLDKGIDAFQQHVLGAGPQDNESAFEQQKDKMIANTIRSQYKGMTGSDFPIKEKPKN